MTFKVGINFFLSTNCSSCNATLGCWRWLWVLCQTTAGDALLSPKLLRGVWQRRWHDECGRVPHVLLSGRGLSVCLLCHNLDSCLFHVFTSLPRPVYQILKPSEKKAKYQYGGVNSGRPVTPPRTTQAPKKRWVAGPQLLCSSPRWSPGHAPPGCLKHSCIQRLNV